MIAFTEREMELLKVLETRRQLSKRHRQLSMETTNKRNLLEQQRKLLKELESENTLLYNSLRADIRHGRTRKDRTIEMGSILSF